MYQKIFLLLAALSLSWLFASEKPLLIGTNAEFPPFAYLENKEIVGFDIDVAKEVAKRLDREISFKDMPFDALIPALVLGKVDFVAAGMSYSKERAKRVLFTKSYLSNDPLVILTPNGKSLSLDELTNKKVVVIEGFTADLFISSMKGIEPIRLPTQADGFIAMKSRRADAFVTAKSTVTAFFEMQNGIDFETTPIEGTGETCAIVVPKSKPEILEEVQRALDEMERDGTMMKLKTKWKLL